MAVIRRTTGVRMTVPAGVTLAPAARGARRTGSEAEREAAELVGLLLRDERDATRVDDIPLDVRPAPAKRGARGKAGAAPPTRTVAVEVDLEPGEDAVALLAADGHYSWHFASGGARAKTSSAAKAAKGARKARGARGSGVTRSIEVTLVAPSAPTRPARGARAAAAPAARSLFARARLFVFKTVSGVVAGGLMALLERKVDEGIVHVNSVDVTAWRRPGSLTRLLSESPLPADRPARVLLMVHGTFSSTAGSFGGLAAREPDAFLARALGQYDLVFGIDHRTLSLDPTQNAVALLKELEAVRWPKPPRFDAVAFSRGGLVLRALLEHLLPRSPLRIAFDRCVFVGCTNGGTLLAAAENWHELADLYTNLVVGACRRAGWALNAEPAATVVGEVMKGIGAFVKYLASSALSDGDIPGLAAMTPTGEYVRTLNRAQPGQPTPDTSHYCAVTSAFRPRLVGEEPFFRGLPRRLVQTLAGAFTERLMKVDNDLVVHTSSMTEIDPGPGGFIKSCLAFDQNDRVYHTVYFVQPEVVAKLAEWLLRPVK